MITQIKMVGFGSLAVDYGESPTQDLYKLKKDLGVCGESSVIFVRTDDLANILIDTGFKSEWDLRIENLALNRREIKKSLDITGVETTEITEVFVTHWHHDHFGNLPVFPNATICYAGVEGHEVNLLAEQCGFSQKLGALREGKAWHKGLTILHTPGHNAAHHAVILEWQGRKFVAAGDAIVSKAYYDRNEVYSYNSDFLSRETALRSMDRIRQVADVITPGHGQPFENYLRWSSNS